MMLPLSRIPFLPYKHTGLNSCGMSSSLSVQVQKALPLKIRIPLQMARDENMYRYIIPRLGTTDNVNIR
jgi:hypothetical protein